MKKHKKKKPFNVFDFFYKKQFRKDLVDKLNVCYVQELDLKCTVHFRGYLRYNASDRNLFSFKQILAYLYIFESFFNQRVLFTFFQKKNIQRDQPADYFYKFKCDIEKRKYFFYFLTVLYSTFFFKNFFKMLIKPLLVYDFKANRFFLKRISFYQTAWIKKFLDIDIDKEFNSIIELKTSLIYLLLLLSRYQLLSFSEFKTKKEDTKLPSHSALKNIIKKK